MLRTHLRNLREETRVQNDQSSILSHILKKARLREGLTQDELAEKLGVDSRTIRRWESTEQAPALLHRRKLRTVLGLSSAELSILEDEDSIGSPDVAEVLVSAFDDPDAQVRQHIVRVLGDIHPVSSSTFALLKKALQDPEAIVRQEAVVSLGQLTKHLQVQEAMEQEKTVKLEEELRAAVEEMLPSRINIIATNIQPSQKTFHIECKGPISYDELKRIKHQFKEDTGWRLGFATLE
jgi:transcriptional regulator with XRE-family HTH domain